MTNPKPLLVLGGTGKQGKKLITTILASPSKDSVTILALTRNPESASAKALAAKSSTIKLIKGNLDDVPAVFQAALEATNGEKIWGVFCVLLPAQDKAKEDGEVKQGKDMIDGAVANDVQGMGFPELSFYNVDQSSSCATYLCSNGSIAWSVLSASVQACFANSFCLPHNVIADLQSQCSSILQSIDTARNPIPTQHLSLTSPANTTSNCT